MRARDPHRRPPRSCTTRPAWCDGSILAAGCPPRLATRRQVFGISRQRRRIARDPGHRPCLTCPHGRSPVGRAVRRDRPGLVRGAEPVRRRGARRPAARPGARPGRGRGPQRDLAGPARLDGHRGRLLPGRARQGTAAGRRDRRALGAAPTRRGGTSPRRTTSRWWPTCSCRPRSGAPPCERRTPRCVPGGTLFVVAHDSLNLTDGTGGPQDPSVLYTAEDVLGDLAGEDFDTGRAGRVERPVGDATALTRWSGWSGARCAAPFGAVASGISRRSGKAEVRRRDGVPSSRRQRRQIGCESPRSRRSEWRDAP